MFEGLFYHGNKSTILLFYPIFRTTPEVSSKLYFVEISQTSYGFLITKELTFGFQILDLTLSGGLRGPDDQTHSCQSETSCFMMPKLGDF